MFLPLRIEFESSSRFDRVGFRETCGGKDGSSADVKRPYEPGRRLTPP